MRFFVFLINRSPPPHKTLKQHRTYISTSPRLYFRRGVYWLTYQARLQLISDFNTGRPCNVSSSDLRYSFSRWRLSSSCVATSSSRARRSWSACSSRSRVRSSCSIRSCSCQYSACNRSMQLAS
jgi:hypothetical protein